jgi:hypothetical protein
MFRAVSAQSYAIFGISRRHLQPGAELPSDIQLILHRFVINADRRVVRWTRIMAERHLLYLE